MYLNARNTYHTVVQLKMQEQVPEKIFVADLELNTAKVKSTMNTSWNTLQQLDIQLTTAFLKEKYMPESEF